LSILSYFSIIFCGRTQIEPIQELRKVITEILFYLANDYSIIHNAHIVDKEEALSLCKNLRRLGANLLSRRLSLISNSIFSKADDIYYRLDFYRIEICEALDIEDPIQDGMSKQDLNDAIKEIHNQKIA